MDVSWKNNVVELIGTLGGVPKYSHTSKDREYYVFQLDIQRLSGTVDSINITSGRELLSWLVITDQAHIKVRGELKSFNNKS